VANSFKKGQIWQIWYLKRLNGNPEINMIFDLFFTSITKASTKLISYMALLPDFVINLKAQNL